MAGKGLLLSLDNAKPDWRRRLCRASRWGGDRLPRAAVRSGAESRKRTVCTSETEMAILPSPTGDLHSNWIREEERLEG